jgi:hypothetical protein
MSPAPATEAPKSLLAGPLTELAAMTQLAAARALGAPSAVKKIRGQAPSWRKDAVTEEAFESGSS